EEHHAWAGHERAADGAHLLLAARDVARERLAALPEAREVAVDHLQVGGHGAAAVAAREGAGEQVLLYREVAEAMAALHHLDAAAAHQIVGREPVDALAGEFDPALCHLAPFRADQVGDRLERG